MNPTFLAEIGAEGRYRFIGREDDPIVTAGDNVGPSEVENLVLAHPGAPDPARGTVVRAVVVLNGTVPQDQVAAEIQESVRTGLERHAYPRIVDFVAELPRTETGKVRRNILREGP